VPLALLVEGTELDRHIRRANPQTAKLAGCPTEDETTTMCGICGIGFADSGAVADSDLVVRMRDVMAHRGPDGAGVVSFPGAALAHRRLSIIDIEHGEQPMANEDDTIWVTFNGEIYNYPDLRRQLLARGHRFRTNCDTEVLVHAYEEYGDAFVNRLNGMFAFAVLDLRRQRLLLARDPLGIKPLFYALQGDRLIFASEIKGVLPALGRSGSMRPQSLQEYLIFRYVAWDRTFYENVMRLPPGHLAVWEAGRFSIERYWSPADSTEASDQSLGSAVTRLDMHLERAVRLQLISDVPLGAFCSGGVDSGLVTAYAARNAAGPFQTFSVGFEDPAWDETELARDTAARAGTDHHVVLATGGALEGILRRLIHYHDEPLSHPNSAPLYELSGLARRHVKVVLTGEGADELFGGYPRYHLARWRGMLDVAPGRLRRLGGAILGALPGHRAEKAALLLPPELEESILLNSAYVDPAVVASLTGASVDAALDARRALVAETVRPGDPVGSISRYELLTYLTCALDRMDRMSMAHGLEARVPFLDVRLVEWAAGLASGLKLGVRSNKRVVKHLARGVLSPRIVDGPKSGFGLPLDAWFRRPELGSLMDRIRDPEHPAAANLDSALARRIADAHAAGTADHGEILWLLANVYLWHEG
jgi:asparagine synthase (glutamine-hydrolysing)